MEHIQAGCTLLPSLWQRSNHSSLPLWLYQFGNKQTVILLEGFQCHIFAPNDQGGHFDILHKGLPFLGGFAVTNEGKITDGIHIWDMPNTTTENWDSGVVTEQPLTFEEACDNYSLYSFDDKLIIWRRHQSWDDDDIDDDIPYLLGGETFLQELRARLASRDWPTQPQGGGPVWLFDDGTTLDVSAFKDKAAVISKPYTNSSTPSGLQLSLLHLNPPTSPWTISLPEKKYDSVSPYNRVCISTKHVFRIYWDPDGSEVAVFSLSDGQILGKFRPPIYVDYKDGRNSEEYADHLSGPASSVDGSFVVFGDPFRVFYAFCIDGQDVKMAVWKVPRDSIGVVYVSGQSWDELELRLMTKELSTMKIDREPDCVVELDTSCSG